MSAINPQENDNDGRTMHAKFASSTTQPTNSSSSTGIGGILSTPVGAQGGSTQGTYILSYYLIPPIT